MVQKTYLVTVYEKLEYKVPVTVELEENLLENDKLDLEQHSTIAQSIVDNGFKNINKDHFWDGQEAPNDDGQIEIEDTETNHTYYINF